jgi:alpha-2-macroglobulin
MNRNLILSCLGMVVILLGFAFVAAAFEQPSGSISGAVSLEKAEFHLQNFDLRGKKVYVTASGPRGRRNQEYGVWVKPSGKFRIDHLAKGEYLLKAHAEGYTTIYQSGIFVDDGGVNRIEHPIALEILNPSVSIASNRRVFTSKEQPEFWLNCSGANKANVRIYQTDIVKLMRSTNAANKKLTEQLNTPKGAHTSVEFYDPQVTFSNNLNITKGQGTKEPDLFPNQKAVQDLDRKLELNGDGAAGVAFKLKNPLPAGDYVGLAEVSNDLGEKDWDIFWFNVSDLGLIVKYDSQKLIARAIDLNTLKPVANALIDVIGSDGTNYKGKSLHGSTGKDGLVTISLSESLNLPADFNLLAIGTYAQGRAYGNVWASTDDSASEHYKTYFYTERPVYRLGQDVYFKCMNRQLVGEGYRIPDKGMAVSAVMEDPDNNKIWQGKYLDDAHGCFNGTVHIPLEGKTGAYQITFTYPSGTVDYERFEVAEYRKPEYEVTVVPLEPRIVAGGKIKARIKAKYYFGAPVANAQVKYSTYASNDWESRYRLMSRPEYCNYFDDWEDDDNPSTSYGSGGDYIGEGTAQTDANGEALVEIETKKLSPPVDSPYGADYFDKNYKIEAEVTDLSRMSVVSSGNCSVTAGSFALFVQLSDYVVMAGKPIKATILAVDYDGKPVANQKAVVKLNRWIWNQKESTYVGKENEATQSIVTDATGKALVTLDGKSSMPTDNYFVTAEAQDHAGDAIYDQSSVWIASDSQPYLCNSEQAKKQTLDVKLDKSAYQPGDIAKAMVTAPLTGQEGAEAIVAVEGTCIHKFWTVPMTATAKLIEIPIEPGYAPNVYVTVTLVGPKHQYYNQSKIIRVSPKGHFLNIAVSTDKEQYKPGDTAKYVIKVTNKDGLPMPDTELSLGVVDESIYAIRSETAANIQKFFYDRRPNWVITNSTFGEEYSGGPDKMEPRVRKDFRDTAAWQPTLYTNKSGIATASIKLPDNLTTWRATVRGITMGTDVGAAVNKVISTQDLIVRLALPRFFTVGDDTFISAVVHNYTHEAQPIKLTLTASSQFAIKEKLEQRLTVLPDKAERFSWPVKLIDSGVATIGVKAIGKSAGDALENKVSVLALGVPDFFVKSGELVEDPTSATIPAELLTNMCPGTFQHNLSVSASSIGPVVGNFNKLIDYPYGCTEQTMSRLMPSIVAMTLHQKLNLPISKADGDLFADVYKRSIARLNDYQHSDGGWGWWQTDESSPYLTALVLEGFSQLKQVGYKMDDGQTKRANIWLTKACADLQKQLADPKRAAYSEEFKAYEDREYNIDLAKAIYTLSLYKNKIPPNVKNWLISRKAALPPEALSYLTLALKNTNDSRFNLSYRELIQLANRQDNFVDWDHTEALLNRMGVPLKFYDYTYRFTGVETTALALRTVLVVEPGNSELIEAIKRWLLLQRDNNGWCNTKTTAEVFRALLEEQLAFNGKTSINETLEVNLAQTLLKQFIFTADNMYAAESQLSLPLPDKQQQITLNKSGSGRVYYNSLMTYTRRLKPGENIAAKGSPQGLSLQRSFYRLSPSAVTSDGKIHFHSDRITDNVITAGETVLMKVKVTSPTAIPYIILEAFLPSGAEVVDDPSKKDLIKKEDDSNFRGDWSMAWCTHQDNLDDRIVFFGSSLPQGDSEFSVLVRMEMPGSYQINPLKLEGMYAKNVRAYSNLDQISVKEMK